MLLAVYSTSLLLHGCNSEQLVKSYCLSILSNFAHFCHVPPNDSCPGLSSANLFYYCFYGSY